MLVLPLVANCLSAPEGKAIQTSQHLADASHFTAGCVQWRVLNLFSLLSLSWNRNSTLISVVYASFPQVSSTYRGFHPPSPHSMHTPSVATGQFYWLFLKMCVCMILPIEKQDSCPLDSSHFLGFRNPCSWNLPPVSPCNWWHIMRYWLPGTSDLI